MKPIRFLVLLAIFASLLAVDGSAGAGPLPSSYCADGASPPCIVSATRNDVDVLSTDPTYTVWTNLITGSASDEFLWGVWKDGDFELGASARSDRWVVKIDVGSIIPRVVFTHGDDVEVNRFDDGSGTYQVKISANPVLIVGDCDQSAPWPWPCDSTATRQWDGYLDGQVTDYGAWSVPAQRAAFYGMNFNSNISATSLPPEIVNDPVTGAEQILVRLANPHYEDDGSTLFHGFAHQRIPNAFLREVYGIDAPSSLTTGGLVPVVTGSGAGSVGVALEPGGGAVQVDATGLTFSARILRVKRGVITPTRPTDLHGARLGPASGRLRFDPASPRGSRITGYQSRCVHNAHVVTTNGKASPMTVSGLHQGVAYDCRIRAKSKAGLGAPSASVRIPAHPA